VPETSPFYTTQIKHKSFYLVALVAEREPILLAVSSCPVGVKYIIISSQPSSSSEAGKWCKI
jgi:hypothetical protein